MRALVKAWVKLCAWSVFVRFKRCTGGLERRRCVCVCVQTLHSLNGQNMVVSCCCDREDVVVGNFQAIGKLGAIERLITQVLFGDQSP